MANTHPSFQPVSAMNAPRFAGILILVRLPHVPFDPSGASLADVGSNGMGPRLGDV